MAFPDSEELDRVNNRNTREYIPVIMFVAAVIVIGTIANIFATIFYCCKVKKSAFQIFMFCLSLNDLITNVILIERLLALFYSVEYGTSALCKLFYVLRHFLAGNSLSFMVAIGFDRCRRVCFPFSKQISFRKAWFVSFGLMTISFVVSGRYFETVGVVLLDIKTENNSTVKGSYCLLSQEQRSASIERVFHFIDICLHGMLTFLLVIFYSLVLWKLIKMRQTLNVNKNVKITMHNNNKCMEDRIQNQDNYDFEMSITQKQQEDDNISTTEDFSETLSRKNLTIASSEPQFKFEKECNVSKVVELSDKLTTNKFSSVRTAVKPNGCDTGKHKTYVKDRQKSSCSISFKTLQRRPFVSRLEKRMAIMAAVITVLSFACVVPYYVSVLTQSYDFTGNGLFLSADVVFTRHVFMLNSAINPFIIFGFSKAFRRFVAGILTGFSFKCKARRV